MKKWLVYLFITLWGTANAQTPEKVDSIDLVISKVADDSLLAELYNLRGQSWGVVNLDSCMASYQKSLTISEPKFENGDMTHVYNVAGSYTSIGAIHNKFGKNDLAIDWIKKCVEVLKQAPDNDLTNGKIIDAYNSLGTLYKRLSDFNESENYYRKSIRLSKKVDSPDFMANSINMLSLVLYETGRLDSSRHYMFEALKIREAAGDKKSLAQSYNNVAIMYMKDGDQDKCVEFLEKGLSLRRETGDSNGIANSLLNLGYVFKRQAKYVEALDNFNQALKINENLKEWNSVMSLYGNIAILYKENDQLDLAESFFNKMLKLSSEMKDLSSKARALEGLATVAKSRDDMQLAEEYLLEAYQISQEIGNKIMYTNLIRNLGILYYNKGDTLKAIDHLNQALELSQKNGITNDLGTTHSFLGELYFDIGAHEKAENHLSKGLELMQKLGYPSSIKKNAKLLSILYANKGQYHKAYDMEVLHFEMHDSLTKTENLELMNEMSARYDSEQKEQQIALQKAELKAKELKDKQQKAKLKERELENDKKNAWLTMALIGLAILLIMSLVVFREYRQKRKANETILEQKALVDNAFAQLEEKNSEILDSINYAKRIQNAILPPLSGFNSQFKESFILYKPKDIVAGDFYWLESSPDGVLFAAADCTGHGVPGAMVSVICNNGLNRSVREHQLYNPGKILDKTRDIVISEFEKSEEDVKDGMDIALCALNGKTLKYAGANNPLWIIRKGGSEVEEIKADKQAIGQQDNSQAFKTHQVELEEGDTIYIFSDGFADQFGGAKAKKMKSVNFKKLLLSIQNHDLPEQKKKLFNAFEDWKGDLEQLDDVCVIGVRV